MKRRILYLIPSLDLGGAEVLLINWLNQFNGEKNGFEIHLMVVGNNVGLLAELTNVKVRVHQIAASRQNYLRAIPRVFVLVSAIDPQIIHAHLYKANILARLLKLQKPQRKVVNHYHGLSLWMNRPRLILDRLTQSLMDRAVVVSDKSYEIRQVREKIPRKKLDLIYNYCNYKTTQIPRDGANVLTFGMACRLIKLKNIPSVIHLIHYLNKMGMDSQLLIAGDGPESDAIQKLISHLGIKEHVKLLGFQANLDQFYSDTHVYIISSLTEDLPMSMIEAMGFGCHVISSDVGGIEQILRDCDGLVVPEISQEYYSEIEAFLNSEDRRKGSAINRRRVEQEFVFTNHQSRMLDMYNELLSK